MTPVPLSRHLLFNVAAYHTTQGPQSFDKACKAIDDAFKAFEKEIGRPLSDLDKLVHSEMIENARKNCLDGGFSFNVFNNEAPDWKLRKLSAIEHDDVSNEDLGQICLNPIKWVFHPFLFCPYIVTDSGSGNATLRNGVTEAMAFARQDRAKKLLEGLLKKQRWPADKAWDFIKPRISMIMTKDHDPRFAQFVRYFSDEE